MDSDMDVRFSRLEAQLAELVHHIKEVRVSNRRIEQRLDRVEERLDRVEECLERLEAHAERADQQIDQLQHRVSNVEKGLEEILAWRQWANGYFAEEFAKLRRSIEVAAEVIGKDYMRVHVGYETAVSEVRRDHVQVMERLADLDSRVDCLEKQRDE